MRKFQIAIVGNRNLDLGNDKDKIIWDFSYQLGFALGRTMNNSILISGSSGVAEVINKGVTDASGRIVNILPGNYKEEGFQNTDVTIATTLGGNEYSWPLIYSCDCLIAIGGGLECGAQISLAVDLGIDVIIFSKAGGVSADVFTSLEPTFQKIRTSQIVYLVDNIEETLEKIKQFSTEKRKKERRVDDKLKIDLPPVLEIISNRNMLKILQLLSIKKTLTPQELSIQLKIPLMMIQNYLQELDSHELVFAKKTFAQEHLFSLNLDNNFIKKLVELFNTIADTS